VITVLVADDTPDMRSALVLMLERRFQVVGALSSGRDAMAAACDLEPDVILLDVSLGDVTGFQVAKRLKGKGCTSKFVFVSVHEDEEFVHAAEAIGASYVFKSQIDRDLMSAVEAAATGHWFTSCAS
jgi:DNA-binding NarL/FixJ family response regulator